MFGLAGWSAAEGYLSHPIRSSIMRSLSRRRTRPSVLVLLLVVIALAESCGGRIPAKESFMLAYIDGMTPTQRIRVRYSDDGQSWSLGDPQSATADAGIGAAASEDGVGAIRIIGNTGNLARFPFRF